MRPNSRTRHALLDIAFALAVAIAILWYLSDAYSASARISNLILILPASVVGVLLVAIVAMQAAMAARRSRAPDAAPHEPPAVSGTDWRVFAIMAGLAVYVFVQDGIGFDLSTFLFVAVSLFVLGERNKYTLILYSVIFTAANIYIQKTTSYSIPLMFM